MIKATVQPSIESRLNAHKMFCELSNGVRLTRWVKDETKLAGENVEIECNDLDIQMFTATELGALRLYKKWSSHMSLANLRVTFSENLNLWVLTIELAK